MAGLFTSTMALTVFPPNKYGGQVFTPVVSHETCSTTYNGFVFNTSIFKNQFQMEIKKSCSESKNDNIDDPNLLWTLNDSFCYIRRHCKMTSMLEKILSGKNILDNNYFQKGKS